MERFDVLVIGSGSGMIVASTAVENGFKTAVIDSGPMGGTCLNVGCVPSKMLIYPADLVNIFNQSQKLGVHGTVNSVDFRNIMDRMHRLVNGDSSTQAKAVRETPNLKWFNQRGEFISDYTMQVGGETIRAEMVFIVSGARPRIPRFTGIEKVDYLTSDTVLKLETPPESIIIVGGGYVGAEYAHFFSGIGAKTTLIQRNQRLAPDEEPEISETLKSELGKRMEIHTSSEVVEVRQSGNSKTLVTRNRVDGKIIEFSAGALMVAAGRIPNSDLLKPEKTGVQLDENGFIKVNQYLETSKKNIWAFGDSIGKEMFKHVANYEAGIAWHNANHDHKVEMDYSAAPHAIFTHPQVASVGLKEDEAREQGYRILVGKAFYKDTAMGSAMGGPEGFVKVIVENGTEKILGGHIIGPEASSLIQEITNAMATENKSYAQIVRAMHIHPAMSEVVQQAFGNLHST
ncbi:MAG TPA: dihydrolipoyl dehydrogenase [Candidatus Bathyarchaeia archaeon]